ncbi:hypothetical protein [Thermicanus aegyptius]|uniref:hypothetical protein n=1 Tax=Thermicanus aegyptius TaxID=94009 RepID=UPI0004195F8E|nr:hypothetical protein [Thermicanus aegyptius]
MITRIVNKIKKVTSHAVQGFEDRTREVKEKVLSIAKLLRRRTRESWDELNAITEEVARVTGEVCQKATEVVNKLNDQANHSVKGWKQKLSDTIEQMGKIIDQAKEVVSCRRSGSLTVLFSPSFT